MNIHNNLSGYKNLATSCPLSAKIVGDTVVLTVNINQGTPNFTINYTKDGELIGTQIQTSIGTYSFTYNTTSADLGTHTYTAQVTDSCVPTPYTYTDVGCPVTLDAPKCPVSAKNIGDTVRIIANVISGGTFPITVNYLKDAELLFSYQITQTSGYGAYEYTYQTISGDEGDHTFGIEVLDNCSPTPQKFTDQCSITINAVTCPTLTSSITCPGSSPINTIVTITSTATGGTYPYTHELYRVGDFSGLPIITVSNQPETYNFSVLLPSISSTVSFYTTIIDSCSPTPKTSTSLSCDIEVIQICLPTTSTQLSITNPTTLNCGGSIPVGSSVTLKATNIGSNGLNYIFELWNVTELFSYIIESFTTNYTSIEFTPIPFTVATTQKFIAKSKGSCELLTIDSNLCEITSECITPTCAFVMSR